MLSNDILTGARETFAAQFSEALEQGDQQAVATALATYSQTVQEQLAQQYAALSDTQRTDAAILAARGVRQLTSEEHKFYEKLISAMQGGKSFNQAWTGMDITLPETIVDSVMEDITTQFPLLDAIDFANSSAVTRWIYNKQGTQLATWDALGAKIVTELSGSFGEMDLTQCKLTAYMTVSKDYLKLGASWLDAYIRAVLSEANGLALETACLTGDGDRKPIGMMCDLANGTTTDGKTTYEQKTATAVTTLDPETYGALLAKLAKTPTGRARTVSNVILVVSPADYLTKVMPATTILTPQGTYVSDVLPFPTKVIQSAAMPEGKAVLGLAHRYGMRMGTDARGFIEYDDSVQFLEDNRVFTSHLYGNGRPLDNNAFEVLDISGLTAPIYTVRTVAADSAG